MSDESLESSGEAVNEIPETLPIRKTKSVMYSSLHGEAKRLMVLGRLRRKTIAT